MLDLEKAIRNWRKALHKIESLEDGHIAELEAHLRDELEERLNRGENEDEAFQKAITNIGTVLDIGAEVYKANTRSLYSRPPWEQGRFMPALIWNYIKIALRKIKRQKGFSLINIAGLAVGMAACILILIWVQDELSYDKFHKNRDQIFRINVVDTSGGTTFYQAGSPAPLGQAMLTELPEVENFVRVQAGWPRWNLNFGEKRFLEEYLAAVGPAFFEIFQFPFIKGDPKTALDDRYSIVLTEDLAKKIFGDEDPMGKIVQLNNTDMTVTGVINNLPRNSHLRFTFAFPAVNMTKWRESKLDEWSYDQFATYVVLRKNANITNVNKKMMNIVKQHLPQTQGRVYLQPLRRIHLHSTGINTWMLAYPNKGNITYVYIFSLTAFCILLLACVNFMNLSTARHSTRAKEVGMRKVVGARKSDLIRQFLGESTLLTFIALAISVLLVELILPTFSRLAGKGLSLFQSGNWQILAGLFIIALVTSLISGSYPAVFLSSFQPVKVIKNVRQLGTSRGGALRKVLVVFQFTFTIGLLICTAVIYLQLYFMQNRDLGYDTDNIVYFAGYNDYETNYEAAKNELLQNPDILGVCRGFPPPAGEWGTTEVDWEGRDSSLEVKIARGPCSYDYLKVFNLKIVKGRFFSSKYANDDQNWVLNETAIKAMGVEDPVGKWFSLKDQKGTIIGILKDFHGSSLHNPIAPVAMQPGRGFHVFVKYRPENIGALMAFLKTKWDKFVGTHIPFRYEFIDENIKNWYKTEQRIGNIFRYFTVLTVFIACLGLFGLASFMAERRTKEIGIRKVLGAGVSGIVLLLTKEFAKWVMVANVIAWPLAYFVSKRWLQGFAYRIDLGWEIFVLSAFVALLIAVGTVSYQAVKAAIANPVKALRYE
ncbi:MAG: FtsX-like permease family protein [Candidatus Aminicenantes bacterium]|nr:FtsX-like permease family protein [Candidatus Aminicenantes bacterium]